MVSGSIGTYVQNLPTPTFRKGHVLFQEGNRGNDSFYYFFEGTVNILKNMGGKPIVVNSLGPGEMFGELALIQDIERTASAVVASTSARIAIIDKLIFKQLARGNPDFLYDIMKVMTKRLLRAEQRLDAAVKKIRAFSPQTEEPEA